MITYLYFVSYTYLKNGMNFFGNTQVRLYEPIEFIGNIRELENELERNLRQDDITILNFKLLKTN
jgi:transcriptional regulator with GAF, ATPase, and Fis domain